MDATDATKEKVENAKTYNRKLQGEAAKKPTKPVDPEAPEPDKNSVSQQSFDLQIEHFAGIISVLASEPSYTPNEPELQLTALEAKKADLITTNKEGRKYGVTLLLASQRPSEISETIFSQCNNFIAMRLTNPVDQSYVKKLLPDSLGSLVDKMTSLKQGEAILVGESIILPSIVKIDRCEPQPSSNDIPYWELWKTEWKDLNFEELKSEWYK